MNLSSVARKQWMAAPLVALALRLFFVWRFPTDAGDTKIYEEIARNWLDYGTYGLFLDGRLTPVGIRMPGYPAFVAAVYAVAGETSLAVMVMQAVLDVATCALTAVLAARFLNVRRLETGVRRLEAEKASEVQNPKSAASSLQPQVSSLGLAGTPTSTRQAIAAMWLAALCPFVANYTAVLLTEVVSTFLNTLALLLLLAAYQGEQRPNPGPNRPMQTREVVGGRSGGGPGHSGPARSAAAARGRGAGTGRALAPAPPLAQAGRGRVVDGGGLDAAAAAVGRAQLARAGSPPVPGAALRRAARGICPQRLLCLDANVAGALR